MVSCGKGQTMAPKTSGEVGINIDCYSQSTTDRAATTKRSQKINHQPINFSQRPALWGRQPRHQRYEKEPQLLALPRLEPSILPSSFQCCDLYKSYTVSRRSLISKQTDPKETSAVILRRLGRLVRTFVACSIYPIVNGPVEALIGLHRYLCPAKIDTTRSFYAYQPAYEDRLAKSSDNDFKNMTQFYLYSTYLHRVKQPIRGHLFLSVL